MGQSIRSERSVVSGFTVAFERPPCLGIGIPMAMSAGLLSTQNLTIPHGLDTWSESDT